MSKSGLQLPAELHPLQPLHSKEDFTFSPSPLGSHPLSPKDTFVQCTLELFLPSLCNKKMLQTSFLRQNINDVSIKDKDPVKNLALKTGLILSTPLEATIKEKARAGRGR